MSEYLINNKKLSDMKKIYSQPTMTVGTMMPLGLIAASRWGQSKDDFTGTIDSKGGLTGGDGTTPGQSFGAKERGFYNSYDNEW